MACDALWGTGYSRADLAKIAETLGSDVPFLLHGGTALGTGRGEAVSPVLARANKWHWVVAFADGGLSTPEVYRELDRLRAAGEAPQPLHSADALLAALRQRDPAELGAALGNDLEAAAVSLNPEPGGDARGGPQRRRPRRARLGKRPDLCLPRRSDAAHGERDRRGGPSAMPAAPIWRRALSPERGYG